jgi:hypothetical protein
MMDKTCLGWRTAHIAQATIQSRQGWLGSDGEQASAGSCRKHLGRVWTCHQGGCSYLVTSPLFLKNTRRMLFIPIVTISGDIQFPLCFQSRFQWLRFTLSPLNILRFSGDWKESQTTHTWFSNPFPRMAVFLMGIRAIRASDGGPSSITISEGLGRKTNA